MEDHYFTLGISRNASMWDIKRAFRQHSQLYHPDKNVPSERQHYEKVFRKVLRAYKVLSNPQRRQQYDTAMFGEQPIETSGSSHPDLEAQSLNNKKNLLNSLDRIRQKLDRVYAVFEEAKQSYESIANYFSAQDSTLPNTVKKFKHAHGNSKD